ncbi:hypothetical protein B0H13DRAFT_1877885 [Mycena leptocephala]|nr:hypothetical protein B0H13DRAFT_1877885 [Mycena leptocephala]
MTRRRSGPHLLLMRFPVQFGAGYHKIVALSFFLLTLNPSQWTGNFRAQGWKASNAREIKKTGGYKFRPQAGGIFSAFDHTPHQKKSTPFDSGLDLGPGEAFFIFPSQTAFDSGLAHSIVVLILFVLICVRGGTTAVNVTLPHSRAGKVEDLMSTTSELEKTWRLNGPHLPSVERNRLHPLMQKYPFDSGPGHSRFLYFFFFVTPEWTDKFLDGLGGLDGVSFFPTSFQANSSKGRSLSIEVGKPWKWNAPHL